jgi:UPF0716 protein FxsA
VFVLVLLFFVVPIVELYVIVQVAQGIGVAETILLLIAVSVVGGWLCKREGLGVLRRIEQQLQQGQLPSREVADGGLILLAGALLIAPGFLSDLLGILLLFPPTRAVFRAPLVRAMRRRTERIVTVRRRAGVYDVDGRDASTSRPPTPMPPSLEP